MNINLEEYNHTCYIVGGGTSLKDFNWELLKDKFVIAINTAYTKLPNAQILYCTDPPFLEQHAEGIKKFKGLVYQGVLNLDKPIKLPYVDKQIHLVAANGLISNPDKPYEVAHGSNSSFAATSLMVNFGFNKIYLLGIDMKWGSKNNKSTSHWHSDTHPHKRIDGEIVFRKMLDGWKSIKKPLLDKGIEVINVNTPEGTMLKEFPIKSVEEVFITNTLDST